MAVPARAPIHASESRFVPQPQHLREGVALCLSGGGKRAALFHLGGLRRLNELGILGKIDTISSVSGGSILAGHLLQALRVWPRRGDVVADFEERVVQPLHAFAQQNIRTAVTARRLLP
ncbi:MAG: patatin-like phospholipase family protein, partial [Actinomycetota bacterium]